MPSTLATITVRNVRYRVERIANPEWFLLPVRYVLHDPRGRRWVLMVSRERPDRLVACTPISHFAPFRLLPASLLGVAFAEDERGTLRVAPHDS
jgi:hypothetical protein